MNSTVAGDAARENFAAIVDKTAHHSFIFVIDIINLVVAEAADFLSSHYWHILIPLFNFLDSILSFSRDSSADAAYSPHLARRHRDLPVRLGHRVHHGRRGILCGRLPRVHAGSQLQRRSASVR